MSEAVPYTSAEKQLIEKTVKADCTENMPFVPDDTHQFVENMSVDLEEEYGGKYTGWIREGKPDGRGTWRFWKGTERYDGMWRGGVLSGKGRYMTSLNRHDPELIEGEFEDGKPKEGTKRYRLDGEAHVAVEIWSQEKQA